MKQPPVMPLDPDLILKAMRIGAQELRALGEERGQQGNGGGAAECWASADAVELAAQRLEGARASRGRR